MSESNRNLRLDRLVLSRMEQMPSDRSLMQIISFDRGLGDDVVQDLGFSPLINPLSGSRYGDPTFSPYWTALYDHGDWFELITAFGGIVFVLFFKDDDAVDPTVRKMCREFATPLESWESGILLCPENEALLEGR